MIAELEKNVLEILNIINSQLNTTIIGITETQAISLSINGRNYNRVEAELLMHKTTAEIITTAVSYTHLTLPTIYSV